MPILTNLTKIQLNFSCADEPDEFGNNFAVPTQAKIVFTHPKDSHICHEVVDRIVTESRLEDGSQTMIDARMDMDPNGSCLIRAE